MSKIMDLVGLGDVRLPDKWQEQVNEWLALDHDALRQRTGVEGHLRVSPRGFANETGDTWIGSKIDPVMAYQGHLEESVSMAEAEALHSRYSNDPNAWATLTTWESDPEALRILILRSLFADFPAAIQVEREHQAYLAAEARMEASLRLKAGRR